MVDLNYMTTKTAAAAWNISQRRVLALCAEDRIEGLARVENIWLIPKNAEKPVDARTLRYVKTDKRVTVKPFVKWAGGKGQILDRIRENYPKELGKSITKYVEPFVGGGAVLFDILSNYDMEAVYICDTNSELMLTYQMIKSNAPALIKLLKEMQEDYLTLDEDGRKQYYYIKRDRFNELKQKKDTASNLECAALFIFLNKTCFNGLYRVNRKGQFNVPMGAYKNPLICDEANLRKISAALQNVTIVCGDYTQAASFIDSNTFVYFDPPYRPLNETSGFTSYTEDGFNDAAQIELAEFADKMSKKGAKILLSNSDPKNVNEQDNFFDDIYAKYRIERVEAVRAINSNKDKRGRVKELLIANY